MHTLLYLILVIRWFALRSSLLPFLQTISQIPLTIVMTWFKKWEYWQETEDKRKKKCLGMPVLHCMLIASLVHAASPSPAWGASPPCPALARKHLW